MSDDRLPAEYRDAPVQFDYRSPSPMVCRGVERLNALAIRPPDGPVLLWRFYGYGRHRLMDVSPPAALPIEPDLTPDERARLLTDPEFDPRALGVGPAASSPNLGQGARGCAGIGRGAETGLPPTGASRRLIRSQVATYLLPTPTPGEASKRHRHLPDVTAYRESASCSALTTPMRASISIGASMPTASSTTGPSRSLSNSVCTPSSLREAGASTLLCAEPSRSSKPTIE
jgi:hypothetical protein